MDLTTNGLTDQANTDAEGERRERESIIDVAVAIDEAAYLCGWDDAIRAVLAAKLHASSAEADDYFEGWMHGITRRPIDTTRLATSRATYAFGYAEGAREYENTHHSGYDAE
jgi:hypothetical protein